MTMIYDEDKMIAVNVDTGLEWNLQAHIPNSGINSYLIS